MVQVSDVGGDRRYPIQSEILGFHAAEAHSDDMSRFGDEADQYEDVERKPDGGRRSRDNHSVQCPVPGTRFQEYLQLKVSPLSRQSIMNRGEALIINTGKTWNPRMVVSGRPRGGACRTHTTNAKDQQLGRDPESISLRKREAQTGSPRGQGFGPSGRQMGVKQDEDSLAGQFHTHNGIRNEILSEIDILLCKPWTNESISRCGHLQTLHKVPSGQARRRYLRRGWARPMAGGLIDWI
ncbi:hypothetical protein EDB80DRAFT_841550 [Ilyonectria destructans]|nr:hypothetical protein EDB80DRAFT_841550 [Ilyonectria destructans]